MEYPVADLTKDEEVKLKELEKEMNVILIAYSDSDPPNPTHA